MISPTPNPRNLGASDLLSDLFSTPAMEAVFSDVGQIQQMLRFEWALAAALEECELAPQGAAQPLADLLESPFLTAERVSSLRSGAASSGNLAIPFVSMLTNAVAERDAQAAAHIHTGATSQDVLDTALVLQVRQAVGLLQSDLASTLAGCIALARQHDQTLVPARTWLQQGPPTSLGLKFAGYAAALSRHQDRLRRASASALVLQFGGAVGTLASLGDNGLRVSGAVARHLDLPESPLPWHTNRDNMCEVATVLGLLAGTLGKIARDISLSMQTEVGELFEPAAEGRGGSSTMPHKRNPVGCAVILAASTRLPHLVATMLSAMPQEFERGLGGWHAEWETLPQMFRLVGGALHQTREIVCGLQVDGVRMSSNLNLTHGLALAESVSAALAPHIGRSAAHRLVEQASRRAVAEQRCLKDVLTDTPGAMQHLSVARLHDLLEPGNYLGSAHTFLERTLQTLQEEG